MSTIRPDLFTPPHKGNSQRAAQGLGSFYMSAPGLNQGEFPDGEAILSDDFESYTDEQDLLALPDYSGIRFFADDSQFKSGSKSGRVDFVTGGTAGGFQQSFPENLVEGDEFWIRMAVRWDSAWVWGTDLWKFMRLHTRSASESNQGYVDWYVYEHSPGQYAFAYQNEVNGQNPYKLFGVPGESGPDIGNWHYYEMYVKLSVNGPIVRFWRDNTLLFTDTVEETLSAEGSYADRYHICTFYNNSSPQNQSFWVDDLEVFTSASPPTNTDSSGNYFIGGSL